MTYCFLAPDDRSRMHATFTRAFADYYVDAQLSADDFAEHLRQNAVRFELSVGAFEGDRMVALLLHGIDEWEGRLTAYDAGTGVIPGHQGKGTAGAMFEFALPGLREAGVERCLLKVIDQNEAAIMAYRRLGFEPTRDFLCFRRNAADVVAATEAQIADVAHPDWNRWRRRWDWHPSWQNSIGSIRRGGRCTRFLEARCCGQCAIRPTRIGRCRSSTSMPLRSRRSRS